MWGQSDHFDTACTAPISIRQHRSQVVTRPPQW